METITPKILGKNRDPINGPFRRIRGISDITEVKRGVLLQIHTNSTNYLGGSASGTSSGNIWKRWISGQTTPTSKLPTSDTTEYNWPLLHPPGKPPRVGKTLRLPWPNLLLFSGLTHSNTKVTKKEIVLSWVSGRQDLCGIGICKVALSELPMCSYRQYCNFTCWKYRYPITYHLTTTWICHQKRDLHGMSQSYISPRCLSIVVSKFMIHGPPIKAYRHFSFSKNAEFWLEEFQAPCCHQSEVLQRAANPSNHHLAYLASSSLLHFSWRWTRGIQRFESFQIHRWFNAYQYHYIYDYIFSIIFLGTVSI